MDEFQLRQRLVERLQREGMLRDERIRAAFLGVQRHRFVPEISTEEAYEDRAVAIKERNGSVISSISQPSMIAQMLHMLDVHEGDTVLEIGTGSGYNAALLSQLVGRTGRVVTLEIEPDLLDDARRRLDDFGYANVSVQTANELAGLDGPFDRIVVTARAPDIEANWWRLLKDCGRLIVPLDIGYGGERAIAFVRESTLMRSIDSHACAFLGIRGEASEARASELFFPNRDARYAVPPAATTPMSILAVRPGDARAAPLDEADVIVARPTTIFALRFTS
ncbi:MAG: methyltransferase domain-containing protein [Candidatus Eremiobacteraeota bacterium]|nr:methyltransferase domain-containing protein [Candidatus Eremiobacteraeota bacterium]